MRLLLVLPNSHMHVLRVGSFVRSMREAPLTLAALAALVPEGLDVEVTAIDGTVSEVPLDGDFDVVGISIMTGTAMQGYAIAEAYRSRGAHVVLGGVHASICPEEASSHADTVIVGMAERSWPAFLRDYVSGSPRAVYEEVDDAACLSRIPSPRIDLIPRARYNTPSTVNATRGCRGACRFCTVPRMWRGYHKRPIGEVVRDVSLSPGKLLAFNDVNLTEDREYAMELFDAIAPMKRVWGGLGRVEVADDLELLASMRRSGCRYLLVGLESVSQIALRGMGKSRNCAGRYAERVARFHEHGIAVQGCFIFGLDEDDETVFDRTVEWVDDLKIDISRYAICTPFPGTPLFEEMDAAGRILTRDWTAYDTMHVVYEPRRMSPERLFAGFKHACRETFTLERILRRMQGGPMQSLIGLVGGLTYRRFVRRLQRDARFATPYPTCPTAVARHHAASYVPGGSERVSGPVLQEV